MTTALPRWTGGAMLLLTLGVAQCGPVPIVLDWPKPIRSTATEPLTAAALAELWVEPPDAQNRDLFYGAGGAERAPDPDAHYELVSRKYGIRSYSSGYTVKDQRGVTWVVKLGAEAQPEVVASRLIWAAGYHQQPVYYLPQWQLDQHGKRTPQPGGRFRPKLPHDYKKDGVWSWQQNQFVGSRPFRGLIVLMVMLNNWDLIAGNNAIFNLRAEQEGARRWYVVQDVGAAFSRTRGSWFDGLRGDIPGFARQGFIDSVRDGLVVFDWHGPHADLIHDLTPDDVRWIAQRLAVLTPRQWDDALRAGGYDAETGGLIRRTLAERIARVRNL